MKTIVVTNRKGGVGKTTVATHLAAGLALRGWRVALVDTDAQGHCALSFAMNKEEGLHHIMTEEDASFADVVRVIPRERYTPPEILESEKPPAGELFLLPSSKNSVMIPMQQTSPFKFKEVLDDMGELLALDFVIVDTGPTASMFDGSINFAADYFLYVTECSMLSFDGLKESLDEIDRINTQNSRYRRGESRILGIIPNRMRVNTNNHRENIRTLGDAFPGMIWPPIRERTIWETASEYGQMVFSFAPEGQEAKDAWGVVLRAEKLAIPEAL